MPWPSLQERSLLKSWTYFRSTWPSCQHCQLTKNEWNPKFKIMQPFDRNSIYKALLHCNFHLEGGHEMWSIPCLSLHARTEWYLKHTRCRRCFKYHRRGRGRGDWKLLTLHAENKIIFHTTGTAMRSFLASYSAVPEAPLIVLVKCHRRYSPELLRLKCIFATLKMMQRSSSWFYSLYTSSFQVQVCVFVSSCMFRDIPGWETKREPHWCAQRSTIK